MSGPMIPSSIDENRDIPSRLGGGPGDIVGQVGEVAKLIGKYGVATAIFAFPVVMGCYGLYFLWIAVSTAQVNVAKAMVGMFATLVGPGLTILLLHVFTKLDLWEKLLQKETPKADLKAKAA